MDVLHQTVESGNLEGIDVLPLACTCRQLNASLQGADANAGLWQLLFRRDFLLRKFKDEI